jgi:hypothetical protein
MINNSSAFGLTARNPELYSRMRTDKQSIAKYNAKTDPVIVRLKRLAMLPIMTANYAAYVEEIVPVEEAVRAVLDQEKVKLVHVMYLAYARQLWKCKKKYSGAALVSTVQSKKDLWHGRGLDDRVLRRLALDVFGIVLT